MVVYRRTRNPGRLTRRSYTADWRNDQPVESGYRIHTFTTSGVFVVGGAITVDYLVIGGGGGGGFTAAVVPVPCGQGHRR